MDQPTDPYSDTQELDDLVFQALEALDNQGAEALEALLQEHPSQAPELRARLSVLRRSGLIEGPEQGPIPERLGDFRLIERLGEGGMGVVFRAEQVSLGREVALKLIRPEHLHFGGARKRFEREVETISALHHPGIVSLYAVGEEAGLPYFAMELVEGRSVDELLRQRANRPWTELRGIDLDPARDGSSYLFAGSWEQTCLRILRQASEALHFAHSQGVLHRDIKPSNLMIAGGSKARVLLLDFGLARTQESDSLTRSGAQLGSLSYMAPEQMRGEVESLDVRTDVYGLGVTLFEMLARGPAFLGGPTQVAREVTEHGVPLLRSRNAKISWEAETIVAKATDPDPARRYASAADLARDLESALEKRPIEARRASLFLRLARWSQRHPARATAAGALTLGLIGGPWIYASSQAQAARQIAVQRDAAVLAFRHALDAVERMLSRLGREDLAYVPGMEELRASLLEDALQLTQTVVDQGAHYLDEGGPVQLATAHYRLATLLAQLGQSPKAVEQYQACRALLEELAPLPNAAEQLYATATLEEAGMLRELGQWTTSLERNDQLEQWLTARNPMAGADRLSARNQAERAQTLALSGELERARLLFEDACPRLDQILARASDFETTLAAATAWSHFTGMLLAESLTNFDAANLRVPERATQLFREVAQEQPQPQYRSMLSASLNNLAGAHRRLGNRERADTLLEEARAELEALVNEYPSTPPLRLELGAVWNQIGMGHHGSGERPAALDCFRRASDVLRDACKLAPSEPFLSYRLAVGLLNVAAMEELLPTSFEQREETLAEAAEASLSAARGAPESEVFLSSTLEAHALWAALIEAQEDHPRMVQMVEDLLAALPSCGPAAAQAAGVYARASAMARNDDWLEEAERIEVANAYAEQACAQVREAVAAGVEYGTDLAVRPELRALQGTASFTELCTWYSDR